MFLFFLSSVNSKVYEKHECSSFLVFQPYLFLFVGFQCWQVCNSHYRSCDVIIMDSHRAIVKKYIFSSFIRRYLLNSALTLSVRLYKINIFKNDSLIKRLFGYCLKFAELIGPQTNDPPDRKNWNLTKMYHIWYNRLERVK